MGKISRLICFFVFVDLEDFPDLFHEIRFQPLVMSRDVDIPGTRELQSIKTIIGKTLKAHLFLGRIRSSLAPTLPFRFIFGLFKIFNSILLLKILSEPYPKTGQNKVKVPLKKIKRGRLSIAPGKIKRLVGFNRFLPPLPASNCHNKKTSTEKT